MLCVPAERNASRTRAEGESYAQQSENLCTKKNSSENFGECNLSCESLSRYDSEPGCYATIFGISNTTSPNSTKQRHGMYDAWDPWPV